MDERPVKTIRVRRADRRAPLLVALVVAGIAMAFLKPWQGPGRSGSMTAVLPSAIAHPSSGVAAASLSPDVAAAQEVLARRQCQSGIGWRVVTMEQTGGRPTRTLLLVSPTKLPDMATDSRIPTAVLYAQRLFGIGFCQPSGNGGTDVVGAAQVTIWASPRSGPPVRIEQPINLDTGLAAIGETYFGPPVITATKQWAPGRYVFEVQTDRRNALPAWFALEFRDTRTAASGAP